MKGDKESDSSETETETEDSETEVDVAQNHIYDYRYKALNADLRPLPKSHPHFNVIETYARETMERKFEIINVFETNRHDEEKRFVVYDSFENRKLLWHGTNVATVAAVVASGLRITPYIHGRAGKGIYLSSEISKSTRYGYFLISFQKKNFNIFFLSFSKYFYFKIVATSGKTGILFLVETVLGKEHIITREDSSLTQPPSGYDSIVAKGHTEPDPALDIQIQIDGRTVIVPQGKPIPQLEYQTSTFAKSEYLVYQENQVRLRYLIEAKFED